MSPTSTTVTAITFLLSLAGSRAAKPFIEAYKWRSLDYAFSNPGARQEAIQSGEFIPENNIPMGLEVWRDKAFMTVTRWKTGVPSALNYIRLSDNAVSPLLTPYPNWTTNRLPSFSKSSAQTRIVSPLRTRVDVCDRLWVLDTGLSDILGARNKETPPQLLVFDLNSDQLLRVYQIPALQAPDAAVFVNLAVDVKGNSVCDETFAYLADFGTNGLVVYDYRQNRSWRVAHNYFLPDPLHGDYTVAGVNFQWQNGLYGLSLSAEDSAGRRTLYFHPMSGINEFAVSTDVLTDEKRAANSFGEFRLVGTRGDKGQSGISVLDERSGVLIYTQVVLNALRCWNPKTSPVVTPDTQDLVMQDNVTAIFPEDLSLDRSGLLWVLTDRLPFFMYSSLDYSDFNFRILAAPLTEALAGTRCLGSGKPSGSALGPSYYVPKRGRFPG